MAKMSFTQAAQDTEVPVVTNTTTTTTTALATQDTGMGIGHSGAEIDRSDLVIPRLLLVQSVGGMSEHHDPGSLVLGEEAHQKIGGKDNGVNLIVLNYFKDYVENLPFDDEGTPRMFNTLDEVTQAGLTTKYVGNVAPGAVPRLTCTCLVELPEGASEETALEFPYEFDGTSYALVQWALRKTGYTYAAKKILSTVALKKVPLGIHEAVFNITPERKKLGDNLVWIPKTNMVARTSEAFRKWAQDLVS